MKRVQMGEFSTAREGILRTVLGSCVGIVIFCRNPRVSGLAHCLLPFSPAGQQDAQARFVDQAIPNLLRAMEIDKTPRSRVRAFVAGGAQAHPGANNIGQLNLDWSRKLLRDLGIRFVELDTGGQKGCELSVDCDRQTAEVCHFNTAIAPPPNGGTTLKAQN